MNKIVYRFYLILVLCFTVFSVQAEQRQRIIVAGGSLAEIIYALGVGDRVVGIDETVTYPPETKGLPKVGYWKQLNIEGILSLEPTIVMTWDDSGPEQIFAQLADAKVPVELFTRVPTNVKQLIINIRQAATRLGVEPQGEKLINNIESKLAITLEKLEKQPQKTKVIFILGLGSSPLIAGKQTAADGILTLAGADNLGIHTGYKQYSGESLIAANPEVIVVTTQALQAEDGMKKLSAVPGVTYTDAWKNQRIVAIDQAIILGMGPRVADAVEQLYQGFYPGESQ